MSSPDYCFKRFTSPPIFSLVREIKQNCNLKDTLNNSSKKDKNKHSLLNFIILLNNHMPVLMFYILLDNHSMEMSPLQIITVNLRVAKFRPVLVQGL